MKVIITFAAIVASTLAAATPQLDTLALNDGILAYTAGDYRVAEQRLMAFAQADDAVAQLILGKTFLEPLNRRRDCERSKYWLERSAANGNAEASSLLADIYDHGVCGQPDRWIALGWYLDAHEKGWTPAATRVGEIYLSNVESPERMRQARHWLVEGVRDFEWEAAFQLGRMYAEGLGVEKDQKQALIWFQTAFLISPEYDNARERSMNARDCAREQLTLTAIASGLREANAIVEALQSHQPIADDPGTKPTFARRPIAASHYDPSVQQAGSADSE